MTAVKQGLSFFVLETIAKALRRFGKRAATRTAELLSDLVDADLAQRTGPALKH
jgi:hypothetical protein